MNYIKVAAFNNALSNYAVPYKLVSIISTITVDLE